jgi:hypothetical protein
MRGAEPEPQLLRVQPMAALAQSDAQDAQGMLGQLPGPADHLDIVRAGHRDSRKARERLVDLEQRIGVRDLRIIEGQQPDPGHHLRGLANTKELDAEVANPLADVPPVALHEGLDVIGLTVGRAIRGELHDQVLGRSQILEPLIRGDGILGCLHGGEVRAGQGELRRGLASRVPDCLDDRVVLGPALPDPALERFQGLPDLRGNRWHGASFWRIAGGGWSGARLGRPGARSRHGLRCGGLYDDLVGDEVQEPVQRTRWNSRQADRQQFLHVGADRRGARRRVVGVAAGPDVVPGLPQPAERGDKELSRAPTPR